HLTFLDAKTPNLPFWNVSSHLKVPALASEPVKVIAPVDPSTLKLRTLKSPFDVSPAPGAEDPEAGLPPEPPLPEPPVPCPCPPLIVTKCTAVAVRPPLSVTFSVTSYVPAVP